LIEVYFFHLPETKAIDWDSREVYLFRQYQWFLPLPIFMLEQGLLNLKRSSALLFLLVQKASGRNDVHAGLQSEYEVQ
jgi:hypothetical protein